MRAMPSPRAYAASSAACSAGPEPRPEPRSEPRPPTMTRADHEKSDDPAGPCQKAWQQRTHGNRSAL
eukprot:1659480-Prymnesium_polylepis.1